MVPVNDVRYKERAVIDCLVAEKESETATNVFAKFMDVLRSAEAPLVVRRKVRWLPKQEK